MKSENIGIGLLLACGTVAWSIALLAPRFRKSCIWRGTKIPMSLRSRVLACMWPLSWTIAAFIGFDSLAMVVAILIGVLVGMSYSADRRKHSDNYDTDA